MANTSDLINVASVITLGDGPLTVDVESSPARFYFRIKIFDASGARHAIKEINDPGVHFPLNSYTRDWLVASQGLYCDVIGFPGTAAAGESFSFRLVFSQGGKPCAFDVEPVAKGTFDEASVSGGELIYFICKFA
jgi:hypothetical protein